MDRRGRGGVQEGGRGIGTRKGGGQEGGRGIGTKAGEGERSAEANLS